ncbi:MAG: polyprenyl synthetase family protein [Gammaproteobacteria bacterium]|nr:polyprenyl synthetase family protein [Gammaproteobacteria bacterium]
MLSQSTEIGQPCLSIEEIKALVKNEFNAVDNLISHHLYSNIPLIESISQHIIMSGGKRLRPLIVLLVAKAFNYEGEDHIALAAVVEFIHTATLLHDDVVDNSTLRRGQQTANTIWGNSASILVGDFLYSRTFQILTRLKNISVMDTLAQTTNAIAEGEVAQLIRRNDPDTDESHYMSVICNKTARLFQAAAEVAAMICHRSPLDQAQMARYGNHLGMAFQLVDDALDYMGESEALGKNIGDDLAEGKPTLPLIHAMANTSSAKSNIIKESIRVGGLTNLAVIMEAIHEAQSLDYTFAKAEQQTALALDCLSILPDSPYRNGLEAIAKFALQRKY